MTGAHPIRIVSWNLEWAPRSRRERIARRLGELAPDILGATEADAGILPRGGHVAESGADHGYGPHDERRKGLLWSRWPLADVDAVGSDLLPPGRFVAATCATPLGRVRLVCACVPWSHAHVTGGRRDRTVWQEHMAYLVGLRGILIRDRSLPTILVGDLNQRVPRTRAPVAAAEALRWALGDLRLVTAGDVPGLTRRPVVHVACSPGVEVADVRGTDRHDAEGRPLSDHDAVCATIVALPRP